MWITILILHRQNRELWQEVQLLRQQHAHQQWKINKALWKLLSTTIMLSFPLQMLNFLVQLSQQSEKSKRPRCVYINPETPVCVVASFSCVLSFIILTSTHILCSVLPSSTVPTCVQPSSCYAFNLIFPFSVAGRGVTALCGWSRHKHSAQPLYVVMRLCIDVQISNKKDA